MPSLVSVIAVNWHGPFSTIEAAGNEAHLNGFPKGLYLAVNPNNESYTGISKNLKGRLTQNHHVLSGLKPKDAKIWVGLVRSQQVRSAPNSQHPMSVRLAERMTAFFLQLSENKKLRTSTPDRSVVLLNRWYSSEFPYERRRQRAHADWPDLIEYDIDLDEGQMVWFGSVRTHLSTEEIGKIRRQSSN